MTPTGKRLGRHTTLLIPGLDFSAVSFYGGEHFGSHVRPVKSRPAATSAVVPLFVCLAGAPVSVNRPDVGQTRSSPCVCLSGSALQLYSWDSGKNKRRQVRPWVRECTFVCSTPDTRYLLSSTVLTRLLRSHTLDSVFRRAWGRTRLRWASGEDR